MNAVCVVAYQALGAVSTRSQVSCVSRVSITAAVMTLSTITVCHIYCHFMSVDEVDRSLAYVITVNEFSCIISALSCRST